MNKHTNKHDESQYLLAEVITEMEFSRLQAASSCPWPQPRRSSPWPCSWP